MLGNRVRVRSDSRVWFSFLAWTEVPGGLGDLDLVSVCHWDGDGTSSLQSPVSGDVSGTRRWKALAVGAVPATMPASELLRR
ncbi:hypothetical protein GE21DRAFT_1033627 [Neurospora crassa]|nr:hypothetical protein GE21DRAFT_1033627 [Neurospora crassa]